MKHKTAWIIAASIAIVITLLLGLSLILYPPLAGGLLLGNLELAERNASGFDLEGVVTDDAGHPLSGVTMQVTFSRSNIMDYNSPDVHKEYRETVNSKFHIRQKRFTGVEVAFFKNGYHTETLRFISHGAVHEQHGIWVKMAERQRPVANLQSGGGPLWYNIKNETKQVCEIWLSEKGDVNDYQQKTIDAGALPESTRYFDFDFKRYENGRIMYGSQNNWKYEYKGAPCPVAFIIRFHSDDPDDGMILMQGSSPGMTQEDFDKRGNTAPETGYTVREIEIPMETEMDVEYFSRRIYVFLKCGDHYGKAEIWPVRISVDDKEKTVTSAGTSIGISINRTPGDRNVTAW
ncbi:MAG: hypothetical protein IKP09_00405 [Lentisphaeria bacterium]|nr:hypothetical protein [Lentisphaeria bacterium]